MKCSICGTESKADARFCSGCGATLILPRTDETMLDLRTAMYRRPVVVPAAAPTPPGAEATHPSPPPENASAASLPPATGSSSPRSNIGGLVLLSIALGIVGYFVYQVATTLGPAWIDALTAPSAPPVESAEPKAPQPAATTRAVTEPARPEAAPAPPAAQIPSPVSEPIPPVEAAPKVAPSPAPMDAAPPAPKVSAPAPGSPKKSPAATAMKPASPGKSAAVQPRRAAAKKPPAPDPEPSALSAAVPAPAALAEPPRPRPDRWQEMTDALAQCGQESFIARVVCEQRVTFRYCDGYWGKVAQCPSAQNQNPGR